MMKRPSRVDQQLEDVNQQTNDGNASEHPLNGRKQVKTDKSEVVEKHQISG